MLTEQTHALSYVRGSDFVRCETPNKRNKCAFLFQSVAATLFVVIVFFGFFASILYNPQVLHTHTSSPRRLTMTLIVNNRVYQSRIVPVESIELAIERATGA